MISPLKGLISDERTKQLITPSQLIHNHLYNLGQKYQVVCFGGPFFDVDIALGKPVCLTVAGKRRTAGMIRDHLLMFNRKELNAYYNFDMIGVEACGALKNVVANIKGLGYKEASHFLRNIGLGGDLAILDRHILKNLALLGVIDEVPASPSKKMYLEIEKKMIDFSREAKIPMSHLDLLLWYKEAGEVFK